MVPSEYVFLKLPNEYQLDTNLSTRGAEYTRLRQRSWGKFFDF